MQSLEFKGNTKEYFKIWIVNIFLTVVTLGIYSAWAKVRTNRYFYSNTTYAGHAFEYTGDPKKILKGRIMVFVVYLAFIYSSQIILNPIVTLSIIVFIMAIIPWMLNKAVKFKLRNTKYRNIRFKHNQSVGAYYKFFFLHGIINIFTIGLAFGYTYNQFKKLIVNKSSYGTSELSYEGEAKSIYWIYIKVMLIYFGLIFILGVGASVLIPILIQMKESLIDPSANPTFNPIYVILPFYLFFIILSTAITAMYEANMRNYVWANTTLSDTTFESSLKVGKLIFLYTGNILAIIFSLGLLVPWAKIRLLRYKVENFMIDCPDLNNFIAGEIENLGALGEEGDEFLDIDIGI